MTKKLLTVLAVVLLAAACGACRSRYSSPTYDSTDSYKNVFEGKYVPADLR